MNRERVLKVVLVVVGLLFVAAVYPIVMFLSQQWNNAEAALPMMLSLYVALGVFLLLAVRNPSANRSLIGFTAWSSFAHAAVMTVQSFQLPGERVHLLGGSAFFALVGVALLFLAPAKPSLQPASALSA